MESNKKSTNFAETWLPDINEGMTLSRLQDSYFENSKINFSPNNHFARNTKNPYNSKLKQGFLKNKSQLSKSLAARNARNSKQ